MKKILFILSVISLSFVGMTNAQTTQTKPTPVAKGEKQVPEVRAKEMVAKLNTTCNLNADQTVKTNKLFVDYFTKKDALKGKKSSMDMQKFEAKMTDLRNELNAGLKGILTADQMKLMNEAKANEKK